MSWIDQKYILLLSNRLQGFKKKTSSLYNFRCPICLDSEKSKSKARGYLIEDKGSFYFFCHNCNQPHSFGDFLKLIDQGLHSDYIRERYLDRGQSRQFEPVVVQKPIETSIFESLPKISQLLPTHRARKFFTSRKLPSKFQQSLFYCKNFHQFVNDHVERYPDHLPEEDRLIIPMIDRDHKVIGFQGRTLSSDEKVIRYITVMLDTSKPKLYGLDRADFNQPLYCFEGPFDSMLIDNAIASCGSHIVSEVRKIGCPTNQMVIVYDNEPRNKQICAQISFAISAGFKVVIWPDNVEQKDLNDIVLSGADGASIIKSSIYTGLNALLRFSQWKRC